MRNKYCLHLPSKKCTHVKGQKEKLSLGHTTLQQTSPAQDVLKGKAYPPFEAFTTGIVHGTRHKCLKIALQVWLPSQGECKSKMNPDIKY